MISTMETDAARAQAEAWLKSAGKTDDASLKAFNDIWQSNRPVLDKVADTFSLGNADAAKLLAEAHNPAMAAPTDVPAVFKDAKLPVFYRANLALAYAKALSNRKVYEEGLDALKPFKVENVVDPSAFYFTQAVAEHALMMKKDAVKSIGHLLEDVADTPERYRVVSALMHLDMLLWQEKDLGWVARKMDNIQRRLDLSRGGPKTQKMQKDVVKTLDALIKKLEQQGGGSGSGSGSGSGQSKPGNTPGMGSQPLQDSVLGGRSGSGQVDPKKFKELTEVWGKLPEKERAQAIVGLTRGLDPRYREAIEAYFKKLSSVSDNK